jgi:hypothetical protein
LASRRACDIYIRHQQTESQPAVSEQNLTQSRSNVSPEEADAAAAFNEWLRDELVEPSDVQAKLRALAA